MGTPRSRWMTVAVSARLVAYTVMANRVVSPRYHHGMSERPAKSGAAATCRTTIPAPRLRTSEALLNAIRSGDFLETTSPTIEARAIASRAYTGATTSASAPAKPHDAVNSPPRGCHCMGRISDATRRTPSTPANQYRSVGRSVSASVAAASAEIPAITTDVANVVRVSRRLTT